VKQNHNPNERGEVRKKATQSVLLLEEDDQLRQMLKLTLIYSGYEVLEADNVEEIAAVYLRQRPDLVVIDLVVLDLEAPFKAVLEVIMDLWRVDENARILTISPSTLADPDSYLQVAQGFLSYRTLIKPFTISQFLDAVRQAIESEK
jgi:DNA-binding response OmpR family regulator